jgi:hypothetical protein
MWRSAGRSRQACSAALACLLLCLSARAAAGAGRGAADHPGPAPLDPVPAGPLVSSRIVFGVMLFQPAGPGDRNDPVAALRELCRTRYPEFGAPAALEPGGGGEPRLPCVRAGITSIRPPDQASLDAGSHGLTAGQRSAVRRAGEAFVLGIHGQPRGWPRIMRTAHRLVLDLARQTRALIWDGHSRECFTPDAWHERRLRAWKGQTPPVESLIRIRREPARAVTLGMDRFGLANLVVDGFGPADGARVEALLLLAARALVASPRLSREGWIDVEVDGRRVSLAARIGVRRRDDPRTRLIEIMLAAAPATDRAGAARPAAAAGP